MFALLYPDPDCESGYVSGSTTLIVSRIYLLVDRDSRFSSSNVNLAWPCRCSGAGQPVRRRSAGDHINREHPALLKKKLINFFDVCGHFCPPVYGSGLRIRIRIQGPLWIRIQSRYGSTTLIVSHIYLLVKRDTGVSNNLSLLRCWPTSSMTISWWSYRTCRWRRPTSRCWTWRRTSCRRSPPRCAPSPTSPSPWTSVSPSYR